MMSVAPQPQPWLRLVLRGIPGDSTGSVLILLDPRALITSDLLPGWEWHEASSRWDLRRAYELHARDLAPDAVGVLLHVTDQSIARIEQLPWDLSQLLVVLLDPGIPDSVVRVLPELPESVLALVVESARSGVGVGRVMVRQLLGALLPLPDGSSELALVAKARGMGLSSELRALIAPELNDPVARAAMSQPRKGDHLDLAWTDWMERGRESEFHVLFSSAGPGILELIDQGVVHLAPEQAPGLPLWLDAGRRAVDPTPIVQELLAEAPHLTPSDVAGWGEVATWWARVRWLCATDLVEESVVDSAWRVWSEFDRQFSDWLRDHYGPELARSYLPPRTVDKIAPFLAHQQRRRDRTQVLVVMDGMGIAQWNHLRTTSGAREAERHLVMAALPTITRVSRQAIFAGKVPAGFAATLESPAEERLWREFWVGQGLREGETQYIRCDGVRSPDVSPAAKAVGIVINTIDDAMHAAGGFDDVGFRDLVARYAGSGFLRRLVDLASEMGWDLWLTADHGNVPCRGPDEPIPQQGLRVRSRGKRVWFYQNEPLRQAALVHGLAWDPPGYPQDKGRPLFAVGRMCYERNAVAVTHGGLSLDEVFVPLVRLET